MAQGGARPRKNGNQMGPVLLGYADERMSDSLEHFTTNKIGGKPDWCDPSCSSAAPTCDLCSSQMCLVTQIYAPLDGSSYHRTLYVFACVQPPCWNKNMSWKCLRHQRLDSSAGKTSSADEAIKSQSAVGGSDWLDGADDWGDEEDDLQDCIGSPRGVQQQSSGPDVDNGNLPSSPDSSETLSPVTEYSKNPTSGIESVALENLNLGDPNGNNNNFVAGASGKESETAGCEATAEIEMDTEDLSCVSVDMPPLPTNNDLPALFTTNRGGVPTTGLEIAPHYIWVEEEAAEGDEVRVNTSSAAGQHELHLLKEYKAAERSGNGLDGSEVSRGGSGGEEAYEKAVPRHGDVYSYKFISTIQSNPGQILRYCRNSDVKPLLFSPLSTQDVPVQCTHCGSTLVFEMQLLPTLVSKLVCEELAGLPVLEFGTVILYSCSESCWGEGQEPRSEPIIVQAERM